jgi:hypothetical protein
MRFYLIVILKCLARACAHIQMHAGVAMGVSFINMDMSAGWVLGMDPAVHVQIKCSLEVYVTCCKVHVFLMYIIFRIIGRRL